jgi:NAD-dependent dihydropyrimidine dehydrogenase PreA subunit
MARPKGIVEIKADKCKGCLLCVEACPQKVLKPGKALNRLGYHAVEFVNDGKCTACGICFYACPEPDAIAVFKLEKEGAA